MRALAPSPLIMNTKPAFFVREQVHRGIHAGQRSGVRDSPYAIDVQISASRSRKH